MGKKSKAHKKKRISKHVLQSQSKKKEEDVNDGVSPQDVSDDGNRAVGSEDVADSDTKNISQTTTAGKIDAGSTQKKKKKRKHTKDPSDVHGYLVAWKNRSSGEGVWKFNKNTQSWLVRHMYDSELTPKGTFTLLETYIEGLKGETIRKRVEEDAVRRALRYKNWQKTQEKGRDEEANATDDTNDETKESAEKEIADGADGTENEHNRWTSLSAHDKRNEYKRTRKIIDAIKINNNKDVL